MSSLAPPHGKESARTPQQAEQIMCCPNESIAAQQFTVKGLALDLCSSHPHPP